MAFTPTRPASAQRTGAAEGTGARFKLAGKSPANLGAESANKSGDKQESLDTSISLCNTCNIDISIIRSARASMDGRCASRGVAIRYDHHDSNDDYTQAGNLFRLMNPEQIGVALALGIDRAEFVPNGAVQLEAVAEK